MCRKRITDGDFSYGRPISALSVMPALLGLLGPEAVPESCTFQKHWPPAKLNAKH